MIGNVLRVRYELTQLLSEGAIFTAYAARDRLFGRDVTVRVLKAPFLSEAAFADKLRDIVKRTQGLNHPNVERLFDLEEDEGVSFLVGEVSRGALLSDRIRKLAPYSVPVAVSMAVSILEGLDAVHRAGLVHGDVSGTNVVIQPDGSARLQLPVVWEAYSSSATAGAVVLPTMAPYLAPEISNGAMPSFASDVYSLGIILFQLLTGRQPYPGDTPVSVAMKHSTAPTPSVRSLSPSVPIALDEVVKKAMSKEPEHRYSSASEMLADLRVIEDAVRFGKPLAWPLRHAPVPSAKAPVAPKMSAVRPERPDSKPEREPADVPVWMVLGLTAVLAAAAVLAVLWLGFNLSTPRLVAVPEVRGLTSTEARSILDSMKLEMRVASRQTSERHPPDTVLSSTPPPGRKVREGGTVSVALSSGSKFVEVPDLRGRTTDEAKSLLSSLNLQLAENVDLERSMSVERGKILKQTPLPRTKVERLTKIRVAVSSGRQQPSPVPTEADAYIYTLLIKLARLTQPVALKVEIVDADGTRTIYESRHDPEETVEIKAKGRGPEAVFKIFYDGEFVKQVTKRAEDGDPADEGDNMEEEENP